MLFYCGIPIFKNNRYIQNIDLKYFTAETADHNVKGNVIHAHGVAQHIRSGNEYTIKITIRPSAEVFQNLYSTLSNAQYDETKDLAQNYQIADLNSVVNCFKDDSTTILEYNVNGLGHTVTSDRFGKSRRSYTRVFDPYKTSVKGVFLIIKYQHRIRSFFQFGAD